MDLFAPKPPNSAICLGTNGFLKRDGKGVMGGDGYPKVARTLFKGIEKNLGRELQAQRRPVGRAGIDSPVGNHVALIWDKPIVLSFPTRWNWWEDMDMQLLERSCMELVRVLNALKIPRAYIHPIGDGHPWSEVRKLMNTYLDDRVTVCMGR